MEPNGAGHKNRGSPARGRAELPHEGKPLGFADVSRCSGLTCPAAPVRYPPGRGRCRSVQQAGAARFDEPIALADGGKLVTLRVPRRWRQSAFPWACCSAPFRTGRLGRVLLRQDEICDGMVGRVARRVCGERQMSYTALPTQWRAPWTTTKAIGLESRRR
jgi:hypothetical protein